jgi:hypothetical protein
MVPSLSTICSGSVVTREGGMTLPRWSTWPVANSMAGGASQMVTSRMSPSPMR